MESSPIIALDLDGTLLRSDKTVSKRTINAIDQCRQKGMRIVIATARPPRTLAFLIPDLFLDDPRICYNGAEIHTSGQCVYQNAIPPETAHSVIKHIQNTLPECALTVEMNDQLYANRPINTPFGHTVVDLFETITQPAAKILFNVPDGVDPKPALDALPKTCHAMITDRGSLVQIAHHTVSKTNALQVLLDRWQATLEHVIAFGDDVNDIDMLTASGIGVAMGNAPPEVKTIADRTTATNDEDGVAQILEELI